MFAFSHTHPTLKKGSVQFTVYGFSQSFSFFLSFSLFLCVFSLQGRLCILTHSPPASLLLWSLVFALLGVYPFYINYFGLHSFLFFLLLDFVKCNTCPLGLWLFCLCWSNLAVVLAFGNNPRLQYMPIELLSLLTFFICEWSVHITSLRE